MFIDTNSATWQSLVSWFDQELKLAREKNDDPAIGAEETMGIRQRIMVLKELLALPNDLETRNRVAEQLAGEPGLY